MKGLAMKKDKKIRIGTTSAGVPDDVEAPELSNEELARAVPFKDAFPEAHASWKRSRRKRPGGARAPRKPST